MKKITQKNLNGLVLGLLSCCLILIYTNCSPANHGSESENSNASTLNSPNALATTSASENILQNMASVTGLSLTTVNRDVLDLFFGFGFSTNNLTASGAKQRINSSGKADLVNAPMWMAITNLSGEFCSVLVNKERTLPPASRSFFNQIDFSKKFNEQSAAALGDSISRMARAFWARSESTVEKNIIIASAKGEFNATSTPDSELLNLSKGMIFTCTSMLGSLDAHR
jgi:hypothetical protein